MALTLSWSGFDRRPRLGDGGFSTPIQASMRLFSILLGRVPLPAWNPGLIHDAFMA